MIAKFLEKRYNSSLFTYKDIFAMFIPIVLDQFFCNLTGVLSTSMVSASSQESVSAVSLVGPLHGMMLTLLTSISAGGTVIVAQFKGAGDEKQMQHAAGQVILGTVSMGVILCVLMILFSNPIVRFLFGNASQEVMTKARDYLIGISISINFFAIYIGCFSILRGVGLNKICLRLTVLINLIHILLSMLFLNVLKMDIVGTALSLIFARIVGGFAALYAVMKKNSPLKVTASNIFKVNKSIFSAILKVGVPYGLEQLCFNGGNLLVQMYMAGLGTAAVAAYAVTNSVLGVFFATTISIGTLAITICGTCIGAGEKKLAKRYGKEMILLSTALVLVSIGVFYPLLPYILKLYQAPENTLAMIRQLMIIAVIPMPLFYPMATVMPCVLRSAGDANYSSFVSLITLWIIRVVAGYVLGILLDIGLLGIFVCMVIEWIAKTIAYGARFRGEKWLNKKAV